MYVSLKFPFKADLAIWDEEIRYKNYIALSLDK